MPLGFRLQNPGPQAAFVIDEGEHIGKIVRLSPPLLSEMVSLLWDARENLQREVELLAATPTVPAPAAAHARKGRER